jgi:xylan 1,4-beta-xylosidase
LEDIVRRGVREKPDVAALSSLDGNNLSIMLWHYHDDDVAGPDAAVELKLASLPFANGTAKIEHFRIDENHSNAFAAWKRMGSPQSPTPEQYAQLEGAGHLAALGEATRVQIANGEATVKFNLPRQAVSLLQLTW